MTPPIYLWNSPSLRGRAVGTRQPEARHRRFAARRAAHTPARWQRQPAGFDRRSLPASKGQPLCARRSSARLQRGSVGFFGLVLHERCLQKLPRASKELPIRTLYSDLPVRDMVARQKPHQLVPGVQQAIRARGPPMNHPRGTNAELRTTSWYSSPHPRSLPQMGFQPPKESLLLEMWGPHEKAIPTIASISGLSHSRILSRVAVFPA